MGEKYEYSATQPAGREGLTPPLPPRQVNGSRAGIAAVKDRLYRVFAFFPSEVRRGIGCQKTVRAARGIMIDRQDAQLENSDEIKGRDGPCCWNTTRLSMCSIRRLRTHSPVPYRIEMAPSSPTILVREKHYNARSIPTANPTGPLHS